MNQLVCFNDWFKTLPSTGGLQHFIYLYSIFCFFYLFAEFIILRDQILTLFHATDFLVLHHALREFVAILGALLSSAYLVQRMLAY